MKKISLFAIAMLLSLSAVAWAADATKSDTGKHCSMQAKDSAERAEGCCCCCAEGEHVEHTEHAQSTEKRSCSVKQEQAKGGCCRHSEPAESNPAS